MSVIDYTALDKINSNFSENLNRFKASSYNYFKKEVLSLHMYTIKLIYIHLHLNYIDSK